MTYNIAEILSSARKIFFSKEFIRGMIVCLLVITGTFPSNDWSFDTGIDGPLSWVFNTTFENGLSLGKDIVFPHGPLAFFMYPMPENILLVTLITSLFKAIIVFNVMKLIGGNSNKKWLIAFLFSYAICLFSGFNHLVLAAIILLYSNYYNTEKNAYKLFAFLLTAFAFYVKSYVAILSGIIGFSFLLYYFIQNKNFKQLATDLGTLIGFMLLLWMLMYHSIFGFLNYCWGMFHLAQDNSSAAAYYPYNNWWVLSIFLLILLLLPFINKTKKSYFFWSLTGLSFFAAWKHGMAREDVSHVNGLLIYVGTTLFSFILFHKDNYLKNSLLTIFAIFMISINMQNSANFVASNYEFIRVTNFISFVTDFSNLKNAAIEKSQNNIVKNQLPESVRKAIGNETVDIYPWDYSIIPANNLNWKPRVVIQSYAAYTSWLDQQNANHFASKNGAEYIVWELSKISQDVNGGDFNSIDYRYLLNDEPQTIIEIIKHYSYFYSDHKFLVLKRNEKSLTESKKVTSKIETKWNSWINTPSLSSNLVRAKLSFDKNLSQRIKSFLYKDEQFWVYLKLKNQSIHKYRFVPKNAEDGIWINPYLFNLNEMYTVEQIYFTCSNQSIINKNLAVEWEEINFGTKENFTSNFFNLDDVTSRKVVVHSTNSFENETPENWTNSSLIKKSPDAHSGKNISVLLPTEFSTNYSLLLDSIAYGEVTISANCWIKSNDYDYCKDLSLVISIDDENGNILWKSILIDEQLIDQNNWNHVSNFVSFQHKKPNSMVKIYVWNSGNQTVYLDDMEFYITH